MNTPADAPERETRTASAASTATAASRLNLPGGANPSPRIAAQPALMELAPNDVAVWSLVGMDIQGLVTDEIVLEFNPDAIAVTALTFGSALVVDPNMPPSIQIDREAGVITIRSEDGQPLQFRSGGEIAHVGFQAVLPGDSPLIISKLDLARPDGRLVAGTITGASANVDFR